MLAVIDLVLLDRFAVNLCCGEDDDCDIAYHFNPRLQENCSIRNTFSGGEWQNEERDQPCFPFEKKETCEIAINIQPDRFRVSSILYSRKLYTGLHLNKDITCF